MKLVQEAKREKRPLGSTSAPGDSGSVPGSEVLPFLPSTKCLLGAGPVGPGVKTLLWGYVPCCPSDHLECVDQPLRPHPDQALDQWAGRGLVDLHSSHTP